TRLSERAALLDAIGDGACRLDVAQSAHRHGGAPADLARRERRCGAGHAELYAMVGHGGGDTYTQHLSSIILFHMGIIATSESRTISWQLSDGIDVLAMSELPTTRPTSDVSAELRERMQRQARASKSDATWSAYATDWRVWEAWADAHH